MIKLTGILQTDSMIPSSKYLGLIDGKQFSYVSYIVCEEQKNKISFLEKQDIKLNCHYETRPSPCTRCIRAPTQGGRPLGLHRAHAPESAAPADSFEIILGDSEVISGYFEVVLIGCEVVLGGFDVILVDFEVF